MRAYDDYHVEGDEMAVKVSFNISSFTFTEMKELAKEKGYSFSRLIRESLFYYRQNHVQIRGNLKRRERMKDAKRKGVHSRHQWKELCREFSFKCLCCGSDKKPLTKDHIVPLWAGGSDKIENIQPLCLECNVGNVSCLDYKSAHRKQRGLSTPKI